MAALVGSVEGTFALAAYDFLGSQTPIRTSALGWEYKQMTKGLTRTGIIITVMVPLIFIILLFAPIAARGLERKLFEHRFTQIPGVVSVTKFFNYDGRRFADLRLRSGRRVSISTFDSSVFTKAPYIGLESIGGNSIICSTNRDKMISGPGMFNVIDYARNRLHSRMDNIADIVAGYDELYHSLNKDLSFQKDSQKSVRLSGELLWCHLAPQPGREAFQSQP